MVIEDFTFSFPIVEVIFFQLLCKLLIALKHILRLFELPILHAKYKLFLITLNSVLFWLLIFLFLSFWVLNFSRQKRQPNKSVDLEVKDKSRKNAERQK